MAGSGGARPLVPEKYLDIPTQRLLAVGVLVASQAIKSGDFLVNLAEYDDISSYKLFLKWCIIDSILLWLIPVLRIPRLTFDPRARSAQIILFASFNWVLFGDYSLSLGRFLPVSLRGLLDIFEYDELAISQKRVRIQDVVDYGSHLLGQHTVRLSPISTARFNPESLPFCLASPAVGVFIPILLNNTKTPSVIQYSIAPLADRAPRHQINVTSREIKRMQSDAAALIAEQERLLGLSSSFDNLSDDEDDEFDEYDGSANRLEDTKKYLTQRDPQQLVLPSSSSLIRSALSLERSQEIIYLRVTRPGLIRLDSLLDANTTPVRVYRSAKGDEVMVVECPTARFEPDRLASTQCLGSQQELNLRVRGTAPMTLAWHHDNRGKSESFIVNGIQGSSEADGLPLAQDVIIPLTLQLDTPGVHLYSIDSLTDGAHNAVEMIGSRSTPETKRTFTVLGKSAISFRDCGTAPDQVVSVLQGKGGKMLVSLNDIDPADGPWTFTMKYEPAAGLHTPKWTKDYVIPIDKKTIAVDVDKAGDYRIIKVKGRACPGEILSPETCRVIEQPVPSAEIEFKSIHECSSDTGVTAAAVLHGTPPFALYYTVKHDKSAPRTISKTFSTRRAEIELKPEMSGTYTYTFTHLTDAHYSKIPLRGVPSITQQVHPLAVAHFVSKSTITNCASDFEALEVELRGIAPFVIDVQAVGPQGSETHTFTNLSALRESIRVPILDELHISGGTMQVDLVSIEDATGCQRSLNTPGATVLLKRVKPTVKFYYPDDKKEILTLEGEKAQLPLRLTGEGRWQVHYSRTPFGSNRSKDEMIVVSSPNEKISVREEGIYKLLGINDKYCQGLVIPEAEVYEVKWVAKPSAVFASTAGDITSTGVILRRPVCIGVEDHADIDLEGRPPFQVAYTYSAQLEGSGRAYDDGTLSSIQLSSRIQLRTSEVGFHEYYLADVGDTAYPLNSARTRYRTPGNQSGTVLRQRVLARPSVGFKTPGPASFCLKESLVPRPGHPGDPVIVLHGQSPFRLNLSIKNVATSDIQLVDVDVDSPEWKVNIPTHVLQTVGPHIITIESFEDSSSCSPSLLNSNRQSFRIDVAETAAIVPFDRREDWCVGDVLQYQLEGNAPWRVDYRFNGKSISATSKIPKFSRVAEKAGVFEIIAVAHQQTSCQSTVGDMKLTIRDLPSARVSHGNSVYEDLREGDQAEILFTLIGSPPFTFTYQRAGVELVKGRPQVLETHTVSGVMGHEYSIFSAVEGTWTVTFIADKYCRYPPAPLTQHKPDL